MSEYVMVKWNGVPYLLWFAAAAGHGLRTKAYLLPIQFPSSAFVRTREHNVFASSTDEPAVEFWEVYTDLNGISRQRRRRVEGFTLNTISQGSAKLWRSPRVSLGSDVSSLFLSLVPGIDHGWHENPEPQWIIPLSGRWYVETMDGIRTEMGVGEISFGGDQGCTTTSDGKTGHLSGVVGTEPAVLMLIQMGECLDHEVYPALGE